MFRIILLAVLFGVSAPLLASDPAHAQASRTRVSGVGDDVNPCSRTAPCKTFAGAISKTAAGGEINCLDPGGFGTLTITKSITVNCHDAVGSILAAGTNGININAAVTDRVVLRNLQIQGFNTGLVGIRILQVGIVSIEDCVVSQFTQGGIRDSRTNANGKLLIKNTEVSLNTGAGVAVAGAATNSVAIDGLRSFGNGFGIASATGNNVTAKRSTFAGNTTGVESDPGGSLTVDDSAITGNGTGVQASGNLRLSNNDINFNNTAFTGSPSTYGNNRVFGNGAIGANLTSVGQQ